MIDLRSDTVTVPSKEMLEYMIQANVGDDVYGEDLTVNELQEEVAQLFGKKAALFVPSGTMSNQICLALNTQPGEEVIADGDAHIFYYENGAPSRLSNIQIFPIKSEMGEIPIELIEQAIRPDVYYFPRTALIALENTHNRHGGTILSLEYIKRVSELAKKYGIKMHLDGARIWNAHSITKIPLEEYGKYFDTISVCFSKGLGAPIGSMLISTKDNIKKGLKLRKTFGGGMRQVGIIAAAAKYALMYNLPKLIEDHNKAIEFSKSLQNSDLIKIDISKVHTNIVMFDIADGINVNEFVENLKRNGVLLSGIGGQRIRAVFHINISMEDALKSSEIIIQTLNGLKKCAKQQKKQ